LGGGVGNNIFGLKVPRHCPLVLLIRVRLEFRNFLILMLLELEGIAVYFLLQNIYKFSSYLTRNTIHLRYVARNFDHQATEAVNNNNNLLNMISPSFLWRDTDVYMPFLLPS
jgi:hypothetical protein